MQRSIADRLAALVDRRGDDDCWQFIGATDRRGYGRLHVQGMPRLAHRVAWSLVNGEPGDMCVLHRCDNPPCCNPRHLFLGTVADNNADMRAKGRASGNRTRGEANHRARLTDDQVRGILSMAAAGVPQRRIAANFGTTQANVSSIVTGRTRTP